MLLLGFGFAHSVVGALEKETFIDESTKEEHGIRVELQEIVSKIYNKAITAPEGWELIWNQLQNVLESGISVVGSLTGPILGNNVNSQKYSMQLLPEKGIRPPVGMQLLFGSDRHSVKTDAMKFPLRY